MASERAKRDVNREAVVLGATDDSAQDPRQLQDGPCH